MTPDSPNWVVMGEPATPVESAALDTLRDLLPEDGITRAWVNLTFIDLNGRPGEVDVLLLTKAGLFVLELKGWHGTITGDTQTWHGPGWTRRNPFFATDAKAKRLKSLLTDNASPQAKHALGFVNAQVVMHGKDSHLAFDKPLAASNLLRLDGYDVTTGSGISVPRVSDFLTTPLTHGQPVDGPRAKAIRALCDKADFKPTPKIRKVGQYEITDAEPIAEGPTWRDVVVEHPVMKTQRRIRIYDIPLKASAADRERIEAEAKRELSHTQGITHDGITVPIEIFNDESGPALVFPYNPDDVPIDVYLTDHAESLTPEDRLGLVRQLAERLRFAHDRKLFHRALAPRHIWIRTSAQPPLLMIRDWYVGQKDRSTDRARLTTVSAGVTDIRGAVAHDDWLYLAPEALHGIGDLPNMPLDVYGFGAVAFHILAGRPPATSLAELQQMLEDPGYLDLSASPGMPDDVVVAIGAATRAIEPDRASTIAEVLELLERAWTTADDEADDLAPHPAVDPVDADRGDVIDDRFIVVARRGEGSSGTALLVNDITADDPDRGVILKVARSAEAEPRLVQEAEVIRALDHARVVRLVGEGVLTVGGRQAILMSDAGAETLADRLALEGRATLTQLEQYGSDLLEAVRYLGRQGVLHRDIKPANLGIGEDPSTRRRRLTLFDLSLSREPLTNKTSGTVGYLDPYLSSRRQYDRAAELWAVSATLFEMATGHPVWWEGGSTGPRTPGQPPVIAPESFEKVVAPALTAFFTKALSPDVKNRYGDIDELAAAWPAIFMALDDDGAVSSADDAAAAVVTAETPLEQSGLSARALSAVARLDVTTVGQLLAVQAVKVNRIRGLGERYRKEIQGRIRQWREQLQQPDTDADIAGRSIDALLHEVRSEIADRDRPIVEALLGLTEHTETWPTSGAVARQLGLTREQVNDAIQRAVDPWARSLAISGVVDEVVTIVARAGRVMTAAQVARQLAAVRGSTASGSDRLRRATALLRVVVLTEPGADDALLAVRLRSTGDPLLAATEAADPDETGEEFPVADVLFDAAMALGAAADELVGDSKVLPAQTSATLLRERVDFPTAISDDSLVRLAAVTSTSAAVSGLGELYAPALPIETAITVAVRGRPGRSISDDALHRRLIARFPELIASLPSRPRLDGLVREVLGLEWDGTVYAAPGHSSRTGTSLRPTTVAGSTPDVTDRTLRHSLASRSALTLSIPPHHHQATVALLPEIYGVRAVDVDSWAITTAKKLAEERRIRWQVVLEADADRTSPGWANLTRLMSEAVRPAWAELMATPEPLLLHHAGMLVRYGMIGLLSELLDMATPHPAARWLLVPRYAHHPVPRVGGQAVPLGAGRYLDLPEPAALGTHYTSTSTGASV